MAAKATALGPTFQHDCNGKCESLGDRIGIQERINRKWEIRLNSKRTDVHPDINGGQPFTLARYERNISAGELPTPEQSFEVFKELIKEDAYIIVVESKDKKESTQYSQEYIKTLYDRHVLGYQGTAEVEQLIHEVEVI